jgi:peptide/nickel transport system substrate-binding protein
LRLACNESLEEITRLLAAGYEVTLGIDVKVTVIPDDDLPATQRALVEKVLPLPFDVLIHAWFDLTSDAPPAVLHREYYHSGGTFRTGLPVPAFEDLMGQFIAQTDPAEQERIAAEIDQLVYDEALSVFLCAPQALYAVNRHVNFVGYAVKFELAETEVGERRPERAFTDPRPRACYHPLYEGESARSYRNLNRLGCLEPPEPGEQSALSGVYFTGPLRHGGVYRGDALPGAG